MPKITATALLKQNTEVTYDTGSLLIQLSRGTGSLTGSSDIDIGVAMQTLYSFTKEEWRTDDNLIKFPFPFISITSEQFELINGWNLSGSAQATDLYNDVSASAWMIKDGGWAVIAPTTGLPSEQWMNVTSLGSFNDSAIDQSYFLQQTPDTSSLSAAIPTSSIFPGEVNQGIQIYSSGSINYDYTTDFTILLREQGKTYDSYDLLSEQALSTLTYRKYAMPLSNGNDIKITATDDTITGSAPYTGMSITYHSSSVTRDIPTGSPYNFNIIIDGNLGTAEEIYEFVQWSLRQETDIDADVVALRRGDIQTELLNFVGDTLVTETGVYIDQFQVADTNRITFTDLTGTARNFPFVASIDLLFDPNMQADANTVYRMFFTNDEGDGPHPEMI